MFRCSRSRLNSRSQPDFAEPEPAQSAKTYKAIKRTRSAHDVDHRLERSQWVFNSGKAQVAVRLRTQLGDFNAMHVAIPAKDHVPLYSAFGAHGARDYRGLPTRWDSW